jgi:type III secretion system HrpB2-like protein
MTPIPAIPAIDLLAKPVTAAGTGSQPVGSSQELAEKFNALMNRSDVAPSVGDRAEAGSMRHLLVQSQGRLDAVDSRLEHLLNEIPSMDSADAMTASMQVARELAQVNITMQIGTSITQGASSSLQTLLKNQ